MIFIVYGTKAEYIKLLPVILELKKHNACYTIVLSQHEDQLKKFFHAYPDMPQPDLWEVHGFRGHDLNGFLQIPFWFIKDAVAIIRRWRQVRSLAHPDRRRNLWIVHGDTFTTVVGAIWGRLMGYTVAHVEAGLRSYNLWHPLPEELDRRIVTLLARVHFAPGDVPVAALEREHAKGDVVNTHVNTSYDGIQYALSTTATPGIPNLPPVFGLVSLHRTEFVANRPVFERTLRTLAELADSVPLIFLQQPVTVERAKALGLGPLLEKKFIYVPKLDYFSLIKLLDQVTFVVTDSGGLQEDCTYMGKPCLVVRKATERQEGLAEGITKLSHYDDQMLREFVLGRGTMLGGHIELKARPTEVIMQYLAEHQYL
jgi:UDP-N-acetylglucosamine 2-epimerase (non-hydrolysing)